MDHVDLKMQVGEVLQLQRRDGVSDARLQVRLIGYLSGSSLIVTTPEVDGRVMIIREGQPFIVRMMVGNRIVGFTSTVRRVCSRPFPYLHLSYPEEMEQITVRKAQRVRVRLFASLKNSNPAFQSDKARPVTVVDISTSGALMLSDERLGESGDTVVVSCALKIGEAEKLLTLPAVIRNVHVDASDNSFHHGLEFVLENQQDVFALHGYVYGQIVKSHSE